MSIDEDFLDPAFSLFLNENVVCGSLLVGRHFFFEILMRLMNVYFFYRGSRLLFV